MTTVLEGRCIAIDIETLSTRHNAPIIQIGAVPFSFKEAKIFHGDTFQRDIAPNEYVRGGDADSIIDLETVKFHHTRDPLFLLELAAWGTNLETALEAFIDFLSEQQFRFPEKKLKFFFWRSHFDYPILCNAIRSIGLVPGNVMDFREVYCAFSLFHATLSLGQMRMYSPSAAAEDCGPKHTARRDAVELAEKMLHMQEYAGVGAANVPEAHINTNKKNNADVSFSGFLSDSPQVNI